VEVVNYPDGRFAVQFNGAALGFKVFDKIQTVQSGAIVDNKRRRPCWSKSRRNRPPTRRGSGAGMLPGSDRRTISRRRVRPRRDGRHATVLPWLRPEAPGWRLIATAAPLYSVT
jgi:hypothetical protein